MIAEFAGRLWAAVFGPTGIIAALALVAVAFIRSLPPMFKTTKDAGAALDALQARRITELERRMDDKDAVIAAKDRQCDEKIEVLTGRVVIIAHSQMLVCADLRLLKPEATSLAVAEAALKAAFPVDHYTPAKLAELARRVEREAKDGTP